MAILVSLPDRQYRDEVFSSVFDIPKDGKNGRFRVTLNPTQFNPSDSIFYQIERLVAGVWKPWVGPHTVPGTAGGSLPEPLEIEASYSSDDPSTQGRAVCQVTGQLRTPVTIELL